METRNASREMPHAAAAAVFAALAIAWTFPLVLHLGTHVPGAGAFDNMTFVWNLWWWRTALHAGADPFFTPYLFHPLGVDLVQHTHTAFSGVLAATVLSALTAVAAQNVLLVAWVFLNGLCAYLLAWRVAGNRFAALCAGIAFAGCPAVLVRLEGHFNLVAAWVLPMALLLALRAADSRRQSAYALAGAGWALVAYCDYYYLAYTLVAVALLFSCRWIDVRASAVRRRAARLSAIVAVLLAVDVLLMLFVAVTGGTVWRVGGTAVSMRTTFNLRIAFWVLAAAWVLARWRLSVRASRRVPRAAIASDLRGLALATVAFAVCTAPIAYHAARLFAAGAYTSQAYQWRSAPAGVDLSSLVLGNPIHILGGGLTQRAYAAMGMNAMEGVGWLGIVAPLVVITGWRRLRSTPGARFYRLALVVFGLWSLGPLFNLFGTTPGIVLPAAFIRLVPLLSNVRIPGRAIIPASLALSALLALTLAQRSPRWSTLTRALLVAALVFEFTPRLLPLVDGTANPGYAVMAAAPEGAVLELPLGLRDGLGEAGTLDHRALLDQTRFHRPMLGGFVARLPRHVTEWYRREPVISTLLGLSQRGVPTPATVPAPSETYAELTRLGVRFIVFDRAAANAELIRFVDAAMPLRLLARHNGRDFYAIEPPR